MDVVGEEGQLSRRESCRVSLPYQIPNDNFRGFAAPSSFGNDSISEVSAAVLLKFTRLYKALIPKPHQPHKRLF